MYSVVCGGVGPKLH